MLQLRKYSISARWNTKIIGFNKDTDSNFSGRLPYFYVLLYYFSRFSVSEKALRINSMSLWRLVSFSTIFPLGSIGTFVSFTAQLRQKTAFFREFAFATIKLWFTFTKNAIVYKALNISPNFWLICFVKWTKNRIFHCHIE